MNSSTGERLSSAAEGGMLGVRDGGEMAANADLAASTYAVGRDASQFQADVLPGVRAIARSSWTALFPGDCEGWDYYTACEAAPPPAFAFSAIAVTMRGRVVAAAPIFRLTYRLDTPLQGSWRPLGTWLNRRLPRLVNLPVMGLGSPLADRCHLGVAADLSARERTAAVRTLLTGLDAHAAALNVPIVAIKDLPDQQLAAAAQPLKEARFTRVASLPVAVLDLPFAGEEAYLASLSAATRKDIRRKLKRAANVRVEMRTSLAGIEPAIVALYDETRLQSGVDYGDFEKLSPNYFAEVMTRVGERAVLMLYWMGQELIGFNLLLVERDRIIDKFIGMHYPIAREHNLYALSWMTNVRFCLERGIQHMQTGQTAYAAKLRFGSRLDKLWVCFKHRGKVLNGIFRTFGPLMAFDKMDPDLAVLHKKTRAMPQARASLGDVGHRWKP
jgi:signal transduction histidine kinase